uniref:RING-type domain-containing protein n=1 Tax=viral metagenome TaxID=1070528 RepID=A0A6C0LVS9_9ZZZZ
MEQKRMVFPDDQDNRIQKLYYDIKIHTIFNRTKLQNIKNKFYKYENYICKKYTDIHAKLLELEKIRDEAYMQWQRAKRISLIHNPTPENVDKRQALVPIFRKADEEYEEMKCKECLYEANCDIMDKITEIKKQERNIYKHYRKCSHCEKKDMVTISGCKSKHKLCSDCSDDIRECPVCEEDLGLQHCYICYEYKKEIVETGCENKHQTCKECLDKIIRKNNPFERVVCPFCRGYCSYGSKEPVDPHPDSYYLMENEEDYSDYLQDRADDRRESRRERMIEHRQR